MNNKSFFITTVMVFLCAFGSVGYGQPWTGSGTGGDPYQIWTPEDMQAIGPNPGYWGSYFKLCADIDLGSYTGTSFNIIGKGLLKSPRGIALDISAGKIYWTDAGTDKICRANLDGTGAEYLVTTGLIYPRSIALDVSAGKMYWADSGTDKIQRANLDGSDIEDLVAGFVNPRSIALDIAEGKMYWTDSGIYINKIQRANLDGTGREDLVTGLPDPYGIALDTTGGKIYWTDLDYFSPKIRRANLDGTWVQDLVTGLGSPRGIALDVADGKMYWTDYDTDKIQRANLNGTGVEDLVTGLDQPYGIALDEADGKMYWTDSSTDKIQCANLDGTDIYDVISDRFFTGVFDGNGHTISNFTYDSNGIDDIGLFGHIDDPNAEIKNLGLIDPDINAGTGWDVGGLVGYLTDGTVANCYVEGGNVSGYQEIGGLVGLNYYGDMTGCYSTCSVTGEDRVGGLVGYNEGGYIQRCYSTGDVTGGTIVGGLAGISFAGSIIECYSACSVMGDDHVGGLVGYVQYGGLISNCYATGDVAGEERVGGLIGSGGSISNCYATGSVAGQSYVGGLIGSGGSISNCYATGSVSGMSYYVGGLVGSNSGTVSYSYWDIETSGTDYSSGGGQGLTTEQMQSLSTYLAGGWGGCDNEGAWTIDDGNDYPHLAWEGQAGVVISGELYDFLEGAGTAQEPYLIYNASQLNLVGVFPCQWSGYFKLMADIDLGAYTGTSFNIIGTDYYNPFTGVFDGNDHTISNFTYDSNELNRIGLFGRIDDPNAEIKNLGLIDPDINAGTGWDIGGLVGYLTDGTVANCYVEGGSVSGRDRVGGLVGSSWEGYITSCYSTASVTGTTGYVGGLVGYNAGGEISNCYSMGTVTGTVSIGGLVGYNDYAEISDCYSTGEVTGGYYVGGLVGYNEYGHIQDCHSTGSVAGEGGVGGLVGQNDSYSSISNCYSEGIVTGAGWVGGLVGGNTHGDISGSYSLSSVTGSGMCVGGLVGSHYDSSILNCYSEGSVAGEDCVGGLVGRSGYEGIVSNCYSLCSVDGNDSVGGLIGLNDADNNVMNCYSTGGVTGNSNVGGLVGKNTDSTVGGSFWDVNTSGLGTSDGGVGLTTEQMQNKNTYFLWGCEQQIWTIDDGNDYPHLLWEGKPGQVIDFGCGTETEPYLIYEAIHMQIIGGSEYSWNRHFRLVADIDLSAYAGTNFNIIGANPDSGGTAFTGVFDGDGHTISNFTYDSNGVDDIGLFGVVDDPNAEVKNLGLISPNINAVGGDNVGVLVGQLDSGSLVGCYVEGGSVTGYRRIGGLLGDNLGSILDCYSTCSVTGSNYSVGGLVGSNRGDIQGSYSMGDVTGNKDVGGLVGGSRFNIFNSYSSSSVTGGDHVGGLVGYSSGSISSCYSSGSVAGDSNVGGLVGYDYNFYGDYTASFWDSDVNPDVNGIGNIDDPNVVGLPTVLMQTESTFTDAGWDFVGEVINGPNDIWKMNCEGMSYPKLSWWEPALGDFICPDGVNMLDFAILGDAWMSGVGDLNWDPACDISEPNDNVIDSLDLDVFTDNYLSGF